MCATSRHEERGTAGAIARAVCVAALVVLLAITAGCASEPDERGSVAAEDALATGGGGGRGVLRVAIAGMVTPEEGKAYYKGLSEYVAAKAGMELRLVHKADYAQVNEMLRDHKLDMAFVCSGPYVTGHDEFGLELLVAPQVNGAARYYSCIIVPASSTATSMESLKGKVFAFADPQSNTGCLVPTYMLARIGTTPKDFFARTFFTYSHDNSIKAVAKKQADGASVDSLIWDYQDAEDSSMTARTKVIARSEPFAIPPVVVDPAMPPALKGQLREILLGVHGDPRGAELLKEMRIERFVVVKDAEYDSIRRMNEWVAKQKEQ